MHERKIASGILLAAIVLGGCNAGAAGGTTAATPALAPHATMTSGALNFAGQYAGTVTDSLHGRGKAVVNFTQAGDGVGGTIARTFGSQATTDIVALVQTPDATAGGSAIAQLKTPCSLQMTVIRSAKTYELTGTYAAFRGCAGETGTFAAKEVCYYVAQPGAAAIGTPRLRPHPFKILPC